MVFTSNHEATPRPSDIIGSGIDGVSLTPDEFIYSFLKRCAYPENDVRL